VVVGAGSRRRAHHVVGHRRRLSDGKRFTYKENSLGTFARSGDGSKTIGNLQRSILVVSRNRLHNRLDWDSLFQLGNLGNSLSKKLLSKLVCNRLRLHGERKDLNLRPPGPEDWSHEEPTSYIKCDGIPRIATSACIADSYRIESSLGSNR
jgi:hypothetical protein